MNLPLATFIVRQPKAVIQPAQRDLKTSNEPLTNPKKYIC